MLLRQFRYNHAHHLHSPARLLSHDTRASSKLFADAEREEKEEAQRKPSSKLTALEQQHENWTGDESIQDAVLRMLVDKYEYKPLRTGTVQTAEQKLKSSPPKVDVHIPDTAPSFTLPSSGSWATEVLLPSVEGHRPWHTEYKAPSHSVSSIKVARLPPSPSMRKPPTAQKTDRQTIQRKNQAVRLDRAKETTMQYKLGIKQDSGTYSGPKPATLKGWTGLIEDQIERARQAGAFDNVKGRGQPIAKNHEESNPFIGREEFLMNRIVQRNGVAPPWVDLQGELDSAVSTFRELLRQAWIRRAVRTITTDTPLALLSKYTLSDVVRYRDPAWVSKERSYHETAVKEVNDLVRKYNVIAPYPVRRAQYTLDVELKRVFDESAEEILKALRERVNAGDTIPSLPLHSLDSKGVVGDEQIRQSFFVWFIDWIRKVLLRS